MKRNKIIYDPKTISESDDLWESLLRKEIVIEPKRLVHKGKIKGIDESGIIVETQTGIVYFYFSEIDSIIGEVENEA